jgi:hypothetical protein
LHTSRPIFAFAKPDIDLRLAPARRYRDLVAQIAIEGDEAG